MRWLCAIAVLVGVTGCTSVVRTSLPSEWRPSPNADVRRPNYVVLHHTGSNDLARALAALTDPRGDVSAHYLVAADGRILQLVDERQRAWHAGASSWGGDTDLNSASIGIELVNDGTSPYAEPQIEALLALLRDVTTRQRIPPAHVLGHGDVAAGRKVDPGVQFPWARLAAAGFGAWCSAPDPADPANAAALPGAAAREAILLLRAFGYDVTEPRAAIAAFHRHFGGHDGATLEARDLPLLRCLLDPPGSAVGGSGPSADPRQR